MWTTGPAKSPKMVAYGNPVVSPSDLRGTYSVKGYQNLHIVGVDDKEGIPTRVLDLRDHYLRSEAKVFGRLAGEIKTVAIWDSTKMLESGIAAFYHVGENVYHAEWLQLLEAYQGAQAVLVPESVSSYPSFRL